MSYKKTKEVQQIQQVVSTKDADIATNGQMYCTSSASPLMDYLDVLQWATRKHMVTIGSVGKHEELDQFYNLFTIHYFCNQNMVTNICRSPTTMKFNTNAGNLDTNSQTTFPGLGYFWFEIMGMLKCSKLGPNIGQILHHV